MRKPTVLSLRSHERAHLEMIGVAPEDIPAHVTVEQEHLEHHLAAWRHSLPNAGEHELRMKALGSLIYRQQHLARLARPPAKHVKVHPRVEAVLWILAALLLLIFLRAHGWAQSTVAIRGLTKGTTSPNSATVSACDPNANCLHVDPSKAPAATVNQGTPAAIGNAWPVEITDGTNGPAAVKAGSTAAAAADKSLVVTLSPNSPLPVGSNLIGETAPVATATRTDGTLGCYLQSAPSTNSTSCKGSSGNFYGGWAVNTTTTIYYLRMYNAAAAPTCSSATGFLFSVPVPPAAAAGGAGGIVFLHPLPNGDFSSGIGFCLTGGGSSTDNTNAATGVYLALEYK